MKYSLCAIVVAIMASQSTVFAQSETNDTLNTAVNLDEVVIQAPKVIRKSDMDVFYPSVTSVENSKNGMQLLRNLMIPNVTVNDLMGKITSSGQDVQVRINGRIATVEQVKSLLPETVKRVEWIDNPGLRYNGANAVLNFIVSNPSMGGSLMAGASPALTTAFGDYRANLKLNNGNSQWGMSAHHRITNKIDSYREYEETFTYADGSSLTRRETPIDGYISDTRTSFQADYSYIKPDTTVVWVALNGYKNWSGTTMFNGLLSLSDGKDDILLHDLNGNNGFTPSVSAYLEQHFSGNQLIAIDANASFYNGRTRHDYIERIPDETIPLTDVNTSIHDENQAYGISADYIKRWKNSRLTAGLSYSANRNRSTYESMDNEVFRQRNDKLYFYGEYFHRLNKVTVTAGVGGQYVSFRFRETNQGNASWNVRPQATVTYRPSESSQFLLNFTSWQSAPSLSETNIAPQQIDGFQWRIGNPDLHTSSSYMLTLRYNFSFPRVHGQFGVRAFTSPDAITPYLYWQNDRLITSYENSEGLGNISLWLAPQVEIIPDWLVVSGSLEYCAESMEGTGYKHYNHTWHGDVTAMLQHYGFVLTVQYEKSKNVLWGETISWKETFSRAILAYNYKKWEFSAGVLCPFTRYDQGSISLNKYNANTMHMRTDMTPIPFLGIRYNLQWGRQKRGVQKIVNADADVNRSSASGR